eukprot:scaffold3550_cov112-Isochrysis_galbana.AAC.8
MPPEGVWEGPHMVIHFVNDVDVVPFPAPLCLPCLVTFCAAGTLSMTARMAKRLDVAQMGHIGQNIRILTQDEH